MGLEVQTREFMQNRFADAILREDDFRDQQSFHIRPEAVFDICRALFEDTELDVRYLADITSVDWLNQPEVEAGRFEVVYNLYSLKHKYRFFLKARLPGDNPEIQSLTPLWRGADWMEREVYDMMGISFTGHPDLTRILTPEELEGHPLRRDFPLTWEQPQFSWNKDDTPRVVK